MTSWQDNSKPTTSFSDRTQPQTATYGILQEDDSFILLEDGGRLLQEEAVVGTSFTNRTVVTTSFTDR